MRRLQTKVGRLQTKGQGIGTLVHSLGSMNLSPMIPDGSEDGIRAACTKGRMIREMAHQL